MISASKSHPSGSSEGCTVNTRSTMSFSPGKIGSELAYVIVPSPLSTQSGLAAGSNINPSGIAIVTSVASLGIFP